MSIRSYHDILVAAAAQLDDPNPPSFFRLLMQEIGMERPDADTLEELELSLLMIISDTLADLFPDHCGHGVIEATTRGIVSLNLSGRDVSRLLAKAAIEACPP